MVKIYLDNGYKKKIREEQFIQWLRTGNLYIDDNQIYRDAVHIGHYVILTEDNFTVLNCILCIIMLILIMLLCVESGLIL